MKDRIISLLAALESYNIGKTFPLEYCLPVYHCVSDDDLPHAKHIIRYRNTRQFEEDLDFLSKHFQWVNWSEFKDFVNGHFKPVKKIALLTFDDGFRDFYETVVPILERKGIYACNFINPAFIDNQDLMFRCKASIIIDTAEKKKTLNPEIYPLLSMEELEREALKQQVLLLNHKDGRILDQVAEKLEIDFKAYLKEYQPYLRTEQLHTLAKKGFGISSHSWDHPLYNKLSLNEQLETTNRTLSYLKEHDFLYESFAFPFTDFGVKKAFFEELFRNEDLFCSFGCAGIKLDSVTRNFQRIPMETGEGAEKILKREIAYFRLKKLIGKNKIVRS
ncbi:MAG: polysaccharide deacetylase family protein [Chryseobacterium sp.]|jgi:peptidoglycan/xylan/chitin deacetylase (PgdA/CDA1 family)|uniref:polysaccharide deacetylase family protein n=1 Tax=Chryseobacterium sp. TaxID=1871047 RepID=UPI0028288BAD|nr:polysaccharide deacetylase family protein [Chryseobacterium sp.]MDR2235587.1 polysaccharide deacetylase family protein [Chryseobacterium sp.]